MGFVEDRRPQVGHCLRALVPLIYFGIKCSAWKSSEALKCNREGSPVGMILSTSMKRSVCWTKLDVLTSEDTTEERGRSKGLGEVVALSGG